MIWATYANLHVFPNKRRPEIIAYLEYSRKSNFEVFSKIIANKKNIINWCDFVAESLVYFYLKKYKILGLLKTAQPKFQLRFQLISIITIKTFAYVCKMISTHFNHVFFN